MATKVYYYKGHTHTDLLSSTGIICDVKDDRLSTSLKSQTSLRNTKRQSFSCAVEIPRASRWQS